MSACGNLSNRSRSLRWREMLANVVLNGCEELAWDFVSFSL